MNTKNNTVLITGATAGIGLALAERFLEHNNHVIAIGRNEEKLKTLADKHASISTFTCDLGKKEEIEKLVDYIQTKHSDINVLVNNAGIQYMYNFARDDQRQFKIEHEIQVNLQAPATLCGALIPLLENKPTAAIVNVTSGLGLVPKGSAPIYCATKAALQSFTKVLRWQLERTNIKVFDLSPPMVDTNMTKGRGSGKITAEQLVDEFWKAFKKDKQQVDIGKVKLLRMVSRISPRFADRVMKKR